MRGPDRRTVLAAAGALASVATVARASDRDRLEALTLFDPAEPVARAFAASQAGRKAPIEGDRIRLARRLFAGNRPGRLTVVGRHADLLLLTDAAREAGYRPVSLDPFPALDGQGGLFVWTAFHRA